MRIAPLPDPNGAVMCHDAQAHHLRSLCKEQRWGGPLVLSKKTEAPVRRAEGTKVRKRVEPWVLHLATFLRLDSYFTSLTFWWYEAGSGVRNELFRNCGSAQKRV